MNMQEQAQKVAEILKFLANPNRLVLLCILIEGEQAVNELGKRLAGISQSAISQHLTILRTAGIVACRKQGQQVIYRIADHRIEAIIHLLKMQYCPD